MKRLSLKVPALVLGALLCGALAFGQGGGQRMGGFRGGFGGRGGNEFGLLRRNDVQEDLQLSGEQKTKLADLLTSMRGQRGDRGGRRQGGSQGQGQDNATRPTDAEREARRQQMEARRAEMEKKLNEVLSPTQVARLHEISIQLRGTMAVLDPKVQQAVGLSSTQIEKIKDLEQKAREAGQSVFEKVQNQEITREQMRESMQKNNQVMKDELAKLLTAEQAAKLKALGGAPFKADPDEDNGR